jgi:thiol peroxidase
MKKILLCLLLAGCSRGEEFETSVTSAKPAGSIDWLGHETKLLGNGEGLREGTALIPFSLVNDHMKPELLVTPGKVTLISVVPSLDTEVCDRQTHLLSEGHGLNAAVERITVSRDLPYAQGRFAEKAGLKNLKFLSDYKTGEFGRGTGLEIERNGLLARALIVVDKAGVVRHLQVTPKIYALPDLEKAIGVANGLVN